MKKREAKKNSWTLVLFVLIAVAAFLGGRLSLKVSDQSAEEKDGKTVTYQAEKMDKPTAKFFVMSFCPYGNQAEQGLRPVFELLGDKVDWQPRYIVGKIDLAAAKENCQKNLYSVSLCQQYIDQGYFPDQESCKKVLPKSVDECVSQQGEVIGDSLYSSLHGGGELRQNVREICAWNQVEDKSQWWDFVDRVNQNCTAENADQCWEEQADQTGLDKEKIAQCLEEEASQLLDKEIEETTKYQVSGSPTFVFNDQLFPPQGAYPTSQEEAVNLKIGKSIFSPDQYRSPEALKQAICAGMEKEAKECKEELPETSTGSSGGC